VHPKLGRVGQGEGAPVGGHPYHQLLLGGAQLHPQVGRMLHVQLLLVLTVAAGGVERCVVTSLTFPLAVEIVSHEVDEVQI
jgi:hypothetical protein